jgi:hypothetical protein
VQAAVQQRAALVRKMGLVLFKGGAGIASVVELS